MDQAGKPLPLEEYLPDIILCESRDMYITMPRSDFSFPCRENHAHTGYEFMIPLTDMPYVELDGEASFVCRNHVFPRFVAESLGMQVEWDSKTNTVLIKSGKQAADTGSATGNYTIDGPVAYFEKSGLKLDGKAENMDFPIAEILSAEQKSFQIRGVKIEVYLYDLSKPDIAKMMDEGRPIRASV